MVSIINGDIWVRSIIINTIFFLLILNTDMYSQLVADAGTDREICQGMTVQLGGSPVARGGSGDYSFSWIPADDLDNPTDSLPLTITNISRTYTLIVTDNLSGVTDTSFVTVTVNQIPIVNAGNDQSICITGNILNVSLTGEISGLTNTGIWSTTGDGTFPAGENKLFTSYRLGENDKISDSVTIILTSTNNGECLPVSDSLNLLIYPKIRANAGDDTIVCSIIDPIDLNGSVTGATTSGIWTTKGKGIFIPSPDMLITSYLPDISDTISKGFYLVLTSILNKGCPPVADSLLLTIKKSPLVKTGNDTLVNTRSVPLHSKINYTNNIRWNTDGNGSFYPSDTLPDTRYIFSTNEIITGNQVTLVIRSEDKYCPAISDTILVSNFSKKIPNAFTPDDDGINDIFMENEDIEVYNRWGQLLYKGKDGWDGKYKNEKVSSGTYFYIITYRDEQERASILRGTVTIMFK